jgi:translation initiation factor RLI1
VCDEEREDEFVRESVCVGDSVCVREKGWENLSVYDVEEERDQER